MTPRFPCHARGARHRVYPKRYTRRLFPIDRARVSPVESANVSEFLREACVLCGGPARVRPYADSELAVSFIVCLATPSRCGAYETTGGFLVGAPAWRQADPPFRRLPDYIRRENAQGHIPRLSDENWQELAAQASQQREPGGGGG